MNPGDNNLTLYGIGNTSEYLKVLTSATYYNFYPILAPSSRQVLFVLNATGFLSQFVVNMQLKPSFNYTCTANSAFEAINMTGTNHKDVVLLFDTSSSEPILTETFKLLSGVIRSLPISSNFRFVSAIDFIIIAAAVVVVAVGFFFVTLSNDVFAALVTSHIKMCGSTVRRY
jgi:hypothetical protein